MYHAAQILPACGSRPFQNNQITRPIFAAWRRAAARRRVDRRRGARAREPPPPCRRFAHSAAGGADHTTHWQQARPNRAPVPQLAVNGTPRDCTCTPAQETGASAPFPSCAPLRLPLSGALCSAAAPKPRAVQQQGTATQPAARRRVLFCCTAGDPGPEPIAAGRCVPLWWSQQQEQQQQGRTPPS